MIEMALFHAREPNNAFLKIIGKATVLNVSFMYCEFISGSNIDGTLSDYTTNTRESDFRLYIKIKKCTRKKKIWWKKTGRV